MAEVNVRVQGFEQLRDLTTKLKASGRVDLQKNLRQEIQVAGRPVITHIRRAVMGVRVSSQGRPRGKFTYHTGLRSRVAAATHISHTRKGIRIRVSATKVGDYGVTLPRYLDADLPRFKRWRHPVFWPGPIGTAPPKRVVQQMGQPYFFVTISRYRAGFRRACFTAMDRTAEQLGLE